MERIECQAKWISHSISELQTCDVTAQLAPARTCSTRGAECEAVTGTHRFGG